MLRRVTTTSVHTGWRAPALALLRQTLQELEMLDLGRLLESRCGPM